MKNLKNMATGLLMAVSVFTVTACASSSAGTTAQDTTQAAEAAYNGYTEEGLKTQFLEKANAVVVNADSVTFTDANDKQVTLQKNPKKVINAYASYTTLWYEAGGTVAGCIGGSSSTTLYEEYIGRDITKDAGMEVIATSSAGKNLSPEKIVEMKPDLVICATVMSQYSTLQAPLESANIPCVAVDYDDFSDYLKWFKVFSSLNGHEDLWTSVAEKSLNEVVAVLMQIPAQNNPVVFSMFSASNSLTANTSNTVVGGMISQLGGKNIADSWYNDAGAERLDINLESVVASNPAMILVQCHAEGDEVSALVDQIYGKDVVWNSLEAVKNGKVYYLEKQLFHNKPNSKFAEAYLKMAQLMYPEVQFKVQ